jgi:asparagine synthase (glutamine-hydrolysing)
MMAEIPHRGPDGNGLHVEGPAGLGHLRLSIIDLSTGAQPMSNETGTIWIVFNGEIYNYRDLREELVSRGHRFRSTTDTEVIVHAYEEWGENAVSRLQGMFAFAIWDANEATLFVARDRVGIKPLYYTQTREAVLFASELKALLVSPAVRRDVNPQAIDRFLRFQYLPGTETLIEGIHKLAPGHTLTVQRGRLVLRRYWDLRSTPPGRWRSFADATQALREMLSATVKSHLMSDVPVGILLSGGVDSTAILASAAKHSGSVLGTFTVGFDSQGIADERPFARLAAQRFGTEHHEITLTPESFRDFLPDYVWHMEEPVCEPPAVALYFVSQEARRSGTKVLLSGEGGDEAFGGYETYRNLQLLERAKSFLGLAKPLLKMGLRSPAARRWKRAREYADLVDADLGNYYLGRTATPPAFLSRSRWSLYRPEFADQIVARGADAEADRIFHHGTQMSALAHMLHADTTSWLPDDLLLKADKMTMAASVELRVPLLDHTVLEFAASLPDEYKVRGTTTKRILKAAVAGDIPPEVISRKKAGFPVPYEGWLRRELRDYVADVVTPQSRAIEHCFDPAAVRALLQSPNESAQHSKALFSLLVLTLWWDQFTAPVSVDAVDHVPAAGAAAAAAAAAEVVVASDAGRRR